MEKKKLELDEILRHQKEIIDRIQRLCYPKHVYPISTTSTAPSIQINLSENSVPLCKYPVMKSLLDLICHDQKEQRISSSIFDMVKGSEAEILLKDHWKKEDYEDVRKLEGGRNVFLRKEKGVNGMLKVHKHIPFTDFKLARSEILYSYSVRHPLFVAVEGVFEDQDSVVVQTPYYPGGDLHSWIQNYQPSFTTKVRVLLNVAEGLLFLHSNNYIHRDIKPRNIIMKSEFEDSKVMIGDFELSKKIDELMMSSTRGRATTTINSFQGTLLYMAPEIREQDIGEVGRRRSKDTNAAAKKQDVYSFGVMTYEILSGRDLPVQHFVLHMDALFESLRELENKNKENREMITITGMPLNHDDNNSDYVDESYVDKVVTKGMKSRAVGNLWNMLPSMLSTVVEERPDFQTIVSMLSELHANLCQYDEQVQVHERKIDEICQRILLNKDELTCTLCGESKPSILCLPCYHCNLCADCFGQRDERNGNSCPFPSCNQPLQASINLDERIQRKQTDANNQDGSTSECLICGENCPIMDIVTVANCDHTFCVACFALQVKTCLSDSATTFPMKCLLSSCQMPLQLEDDPLNSNVNKRTQVDTRAVTIRTKNRLQQKAFYDEYNNNERILLTDNDIQKFHRFTKKYSIPPDLRSDCPISGCKNCNRLSTTISGSTSTERPVTCSECRTDYCHKCQVKWHTGRSCEAYKEERRGQDSATLALLNNTTKRCPSCKIVGVHPRGHRCHEIRCSNCRQRWCYVCEGKTPCQCPFRGHTFCGVKNGQDCGCLPCTDGCAPQQGTNRNRQPCWNCDQDGKCPHCPDLGLHFR